jgi:hypothetical protein
MKAMSEEDRKTEEAKQKSDRHGLVEWVDDLIATTSSESSGSRSSSSSSSDSRD